VKLKVKDCEVAFELNGQRYRFVRTPGKKDTLLVAGPLKVEALSTDAKACGRIIAAALTTLRTAVEAYRPVKAPVPVRAHLPAAKPERPTRVKPAKGHALRSTIDTLSMKKAVRKAAQAYFDGYEPDDVVFEHGQWWVKYYADDNRCDNDQEYQDWFEGRFGSDEEEVTFSVVDAVGGDSVDGFLFEKLS
jgi:hypothetical protein